MLCRMERVVTLKADAKNSTGQNALKMIRAQIPDFFPKHFRSEIKKEFEKLHFEEVELNLLQDEKYTKYFFNETIGTSTEYEQEIVQSVLETVSVQFEGIKVSLDELKTGQDILKQTQDELGGGLQELAQGQQDILENMDALQATMETKIDDFLAQTQERDTLQAQARALDVKLDSAKPADRDAVNKTLMEMQNKYMELTEKIESDLSSITSGVSAVLDKEEDMDIFMQTRLAGDFSNLINEYKLLKEGRVTRKRFAFDCLKLAGKKMIGFFTPFKL
jgi:chromosome segregation ATPase